MLFISFLDNSQSDVDMTATITGGVVVPVVLIIAGTGIVVVVVVSKYHRRNDSTEKQMKYDSFNNSSLYIKECTNSSFLCRGPKSDSEVDIPVSTNVVYELTKSGSYNVHQPTTQQTTNSFQCKGPDSEVDVPVSPNAAYKVIKFSESYTLHQPTRQQIPNSYSSSPSAGVYELV